MEAGAAPLALSGTAAAALGASGVSYGVAGASFSLSSDGVGATWSTDGGVFRLVAHRDRLRERPIPLPRSVFALVFANGTTRASSDFAIVAGPTIDRTRRNPLASKRADQINGIAVTMELRDLSNQTRVLWRAIASDGANYVRQEITIFALASPLSLREVRLIDFAHLPDATVVGLCDGSPIVAGNVFAAIEHPFAQSDAIYDRGSASFPNKVDVEPGVPLVVSSVIGVTAPGQMRRGFLSYLERERAHPYRSFLHYNSWYDIGYFTRYYQTKGWPGSTPSGEQLHEKRNVDVASFLFDDGWDNTSDLWAFNAGFPDGFAPLKAGCTFYGAKPGAWLSPWGGYGEPRAQRVAAAKRAGYETDADGLALSGPKYYEAFHRVVMDFIERGGVNQFKVDGTGDSASVVPGSKFGNNFEAAIALIGDMRVAEPDIFINLTTETYPSPFWLRYCDSIWRGGNDHDFAGVGSHRQRWITYRDADTYAGIVVQGPLFPVNSLMLHGMIYAQYALHLSDDPDNDFRSEVHSYFGSGTQLQEMYITPELLSNQNWDDLAASAKWSARNASVLRDTHWVGGNPARLDVYG